MKRWILILYRIERQTQEIEGNENIRVQKRNGKNYIEETRQHIELKHSETSRGQSKLSFPSLLGFFAGVMFNDSLKSAPSLKIDFGYSLRNWSFEKVYTRQIFLVSHSRKLIPVKHNFDFGRSLKNMHYI